MLYEKLFLFIWWWMALLALIEIISILLWAKRLLLQRQRRAFIQRFLQNSEVAGYDRDKRISKAFINSFLHVDGVFLVHLVADKAGKLFHKFTLHFISTTQ